MRLFYFTFMLKKIDLIQIGRINNRNVEKINEIIKNYFRFLYFIFDQKYM